MELSAAVAERQSAVEKLRGAHDSHTRLVRSMENKQRATQQDLARARSELTLLQQEYDSYKVRRPTD